MHYTEALLLILPTAALPSKTSHMRKHVGLTLELEGQKSNLNAWVLNVADARMAIRGVKDVGDMYANR